VAAAMDGFRNVLARGKDVAFVIRRGALTDAPRMEYKNGLTMTREQIIRHITAYSGEDPVICTTGKASRELFEIREQAAQGHGHDFLTVGSMGHSSSIALGVALHRPEKRVWCIDGDGAALMHMGAMAVIGAQKPRNLIHIIINNCAHETVGGMPTAADSTDLPGVARACGYPYAVRVEDPEALDTELERVKALGMLCLIEVRCAIGARTDLGRPTTTALENKQAFMGALQRAGEQ
ncbi:MAG: phosphonopyruvate decarboxylase, partial [Clostridia bacterium]|nr:phosphonopyruvate decarboxylase [Clostridia bacterium]